MRRFHHNQVKWLWEKKPLLPAEWEREEDEESGRVPLWELADVRDFADPLFLLIPPTQLPFDHPNCQVKLSFVLGFGGWCYSIRGIREGQIKSEVSPQWWNYLNNSDIYFWFPHYLSAAERYR